LATAPLGTKTAVSLSEGGDARRGMGERKGRAKGRRDRKVEAECVKLATTTGVDVVETRGGKKVEGQVCSADECKCGSR